MDKQTADKRRQIMDATLKLIAENGLHGCPTSLIARNAGTGMGTIYRYFGNKDNLINEIHGTFKAEMHAVIFRDDSDELPVRERFINLFVNMTNYMIKYPNIFRFMEQYYNSPYGLDKRRNLDAVDHRPFFNLLDYAKKQQIIRNIDNNILHSFAVAPLVFLVKDHLAGFVQLDNTRIRETVEACWDALKL